MSYTNLLVHIVFRTKSRVRSLKLEHSDDLYRYIWGIVKNHGCVLLRINGMEDHLHLFLELAASVSLSDLVRDIKANSSHWIQESGDCPIFCGWAKEYAAFSYAAKDKEMIVNYIKNQRDHHKKFSFEDEMRKLYEAYGVSDKLTYFWRDDA